MRNFFRLMLILAGFAASLAIAAGEKIDIISPVDGAIFSSKVENTMDYNVTLGKAGGHIHLYLDGAEVALLRQKKGSYTFDSLAQGKHEICLKIVNKNHTPIGVERCVNVTVE